MGFFILGGVAAVIVGLIIYPISLLIKKHRLIFERPLTYLIVIGLTFIIGSLIGLLTMTVIGIPAKYIATPGEIMLHSILILATLVGSIGIWLGDMPTFGLTVIKEEEINHQVGLVWSLAIGYIFFCVAIALYYSNLLVIK